VGPPGGRFNAIAADPSKVGRVIAVDAEGIVVETLDGGSTWRQLPARSCFNATQAIIGPGSITVNCRNGILRSRDGGGSWQLFSRSDREAYQNLVTLPGTETTAIATRYFISQVLETTTTGGREWSMSFPNPEVTALRFDPAEPTRVVGIRNAMFPPSRLDFVESRSPGAATWSTVWTAPCRGLSLALDGATTYLAADCGVYVSRDSGRTWEFTSREDLGAFSLGELRASPQRPGDVVLSAGIQIFRSGDAGRTWRELPRPDVYLSTFDVAADGRIWIGNAGGLSWFDGVRWTRASLGLRASQPDTIETAGTSGQVLISGRGANLVRSTDRGQTWQPLSGDAAAITLVYPAAGNSAFVYGVAGDALYASADAGATWRLAGSLKLSGGPYTGIAELRPVGPQPGVIYASMTAPGNGGFMLPLPVAKAIARSDDGGVTWSQAGDGVTGEYPVAIPAPSDASVVYARTQGGIFRSRDSGRSWLQVWVTASRGNVDEVVVDNKVSSTLYVQSGVRLWRSEDSGVTWREANVPPHSRLFRILADPQDAGRLFTLFEDGAVFESLDKAQLWRQLAIREDFMWPPGAARIAVQGAGRTLFALGRNSVVALDLAAPRVALDTDLWWNPANPGWGVSVTQHAGGQMFVVWFTYDAAGKPTWRFVSGGEWIAADTFRGTLYRSTGPYFKGGFDASQVTVTPVGQATLRFADRDAGDASFTLLDGTGFQSSMVRMAFGPPDERAPNVGDLWFNRNESGWGITLHQQFDTVFATWFVYDTDGSPTWLFMSDAKITGGQERGTGPVRVTGDLYTAQGKAAGPFIARDVVTKKVGTAGVNLMYLNYVDKAAFEFSIGGSGWNRSVIRLPF
jgi:photosystem II stability/assembly factor-like uncharacterized protein